MGRPRRKENEMATTERLLAAAESCFAACGYEAARLQDIAREAGITRPSLLYHFESKEKLYEAVVTRAFQQLQQALLAVSTQSREFEDIVVGLTEAYVGFVEDHPAVAAVVLGEMVKYIPFP